MKRLHQDDHDSDGWLWSAVLYSLFLLVVAFGTGIGQWILGGIT